MTRTGVNRTLLLLLGLVAVVVATLALASAAGSTIGVGSASVDVPAWLRLPDLDGLVAQVDDAVTATPSELVRAGIVVAALLAVFVGVRLVLAELRPGRAARRRAADLELPAEGRGGTVVSGRGVSGAVAADLSRAPEIASASVTTWDDDGLHLLVDVVLHAGVRVDDVRAAVDGVLDRIEVAMQQPVVDARIRLDVADEPMARVS